MGVVNVSARMPVLCVPHGGGPMPLLGDDSQRSLTNWLSSAAKGFPRPQSILTVSAHWEVIAQDPPCMQGHRICPRRCTTPGMLLQEKQPTVTSSAHPSLIYDYYGFPSEAYSIKYDAPGSPQLAGRVQDLLHSAGLSCTLDSKRGWDHGVFVPLKLLYPDADIAVVALSMLQSLSAEVTVNRNATSCRCTMHSCTQQSS